MSIISHITYKKNCVLESTLEIGPPISKIIHKTYMHLFHVLIYNSIYYLA